MKIFIWKYFTRHLLQLFLNNDFPSTPRYQFKFYSDATIKRLNSHIFNMDEQIARALIVHQLLGTRISDTLTLRMDCLREKEGRYLCIHTVMVIILTQRIF